MYLFWLSSGRCDLVPVVPAQSGTRRGRGRPPREPRCWQLATFARAHVPVPRLAPSKQCDRCRDGMGGPGRRWERAGSPPECLSRTVPPVPAVPVPWAPRPLAVLAGRLLAPASPEHLQNLPLFFFFFINCQCFFSLRTCSIWQQESTVGLAGTMVQSLEEFRIVTTHQNKLLSTDQNTKCCDSV